MTVHVGPYEFDHVSYDNDGDVLYLRRGERQEAAETFGTPEGHAVRLDENREVTPPRATQKPQRHLPPTAPKASCKRNKPLKGRCSYVK
jgi:hypothetical protein